LQTVTAGLPPLANVANGHPDAEEGVAYTEAYPPKTILSMRADGDTSGEINAELKEHLRALGYMD